MADVPLPFGLVVAQLAAAVGDSTDVGQAPDAVGLEGSAVFTANIARFVAGDVLYVPQKIAATVEGGVLTYAGQPGVPLTANLNADGSSRGWQWSVSWDVHTPSPGSVPVTLLGWVFDVKPYTPGDASTETDLTDFTPLVPPAGNTVFVKGDKGDKGDPGTNGTPVIVLNAGDPVPDGTAPGTLIIRIAA